MLLPVIGDHGTGATTLAAWLEEDVSGGAGWATVVP
jgi:hypothetical protein